MSELLWTKCYMELLTTTATTKSRWQALVCVCCHIFFSSPSVKWRENRWKTMSSIRGFHHRWFDSLRAQIGFFYSKVTSHSIALQLIKVIKVLQTQIFLAFNGKSVCEFEMKTNFSLCIFCSNNFRWLRRNDCTYCCCIDDMCVVCSLSFHYISGRRT